MALTKDADMLACLIYKEYLSKRKSGESKANAKHFKNDFYLTYKKYLSGVLTILTKLLMS